MMRDQALFRALRDKVNLGVFCATAGASAALSSWMILFVGTLMMATLLLWSVDRHRRRIQRDPPRIPDAATFENGLVRGAIEAITEAQRERLDALDACPNAMFGALDGILTTAALAEKAAVGLARRTDDLHRYLCAKDLGRVRARMYAAEEAARCSRSPAEREGYQAAASAYEVEAATLSAIDVGVRVAVARLESLRATLSAVPPRIVKLRMASAEIADASQTRLSREVTVAGADLEEAESHLTAFARSDATDLWLDCGVVKVPVMRAGQRFAAEGRDPEPQEGEEGFAAVSAPPQRLHI